MSSYQQALAREIEEYQACLNVHELPAIFHYWSNKHLRPKMERFGFSGPADFFAKSLMAPGSCALRRIVSLGSGNCDLEIGLANQLRESGLRGFVFECVDVNRAMLDRGREAAADAGLKIHFTFTEADLNSWHAASDYDAAIANHSLHHVVNLEGLFAEVRRALNPGGRFVIADMIGRNGHQRWPEALKIVHEFWRRLPPSYRFNRLLGAYEELHRDWDCSVVGFEGVRAQDILRLLTESFCFRLFIPYSNVIDPFIDRTFGPNFDARAQWDRAFIDAVHARDEDELRAGRLKPTHMFAVVTAESGEELHPEGMSARCCIRSPEAGEGAPAPPPDQSPYECELPPDRLLRELTILGGALNKTGDELASRTQWALAMRHELEERTAWTVALQGQFDERTAWALRLESELRRHQSEYGRLQLEFAERTAWALDLNSQLDRMTEQATLAETERDRLIPEVTRLAEERRRLIRNPWFWMRSFAAMFATAIRRRLMPERD